MPTDAAVSVSNVHHTLSLSSITHTLSFFLMDQFAGKVILGDLDDFIAPSQSCVNPLFASPSAPSGSAAGEGGDGDGVDKRGVAKISLNSSIFSGIPEPDLIKTDAEKQTAKVSLNDCLACSGCVTSAETVLIEEQSTDRFLEAIGSGRFGRVVVTVSPASRASLANALGLDALATHARIVTLLALMGVDYVVDASIGGDLALLEARAEFVGRYRRRQQLRKAEEEGQAAAAGGDGPAAPVWSWKRPRSTKAVSSRRSVDVDTEEPAEPVRGPPGGVAADAADTADAADAADGSRVHSAAILPVLASSCPGFVCYAEKTHPESLPFLSTVKSPQQMVGTLVKRVVATAAGNATSTSSSSSGDEVAAAAAMDGTRAAGGAAQTLGREAIFHAAVMPCADKKLEASRLDFFDEVAQSRDVDLVLTTAELLGLIEAHFEEEEQAAKKQEQQDEERQGRRVELVVTETAASSAKTRKVVKIGGLGGLGADLDHDMDLDMS